MGCTNADRVEHLATKYRTLFSSHQVDILISDR